MKVILRQATIPLKQLIFGLIVSTTETREYAKRGTVLATGSATQMDYTTQQGGSHTG